MCAINPVHKKRFIVDVYTSDKTIEKETFDDHTMAILLSKELELNSVFPRYRWHLKESTEEAS